MIVRVLLPTCWAGFAAVASLLQAAGLGAQPDGPRTVRGIAALPNGIPVPYASVFVDQKRHTVSDDSGRFTLSLTRQRSVTLELRRVGFRPLNVKLPSGSDTALIVTMEPIALELSPVVVEADRTIRSLEFRGFYRRLREREHGVRGGYFLTADDIEPRGANRVTHMFENVPGVQNRYGALLGANNCAMTVYLDGIRVNRLSRNTFVSDLDNLVQPSHVAGIEIYTRPTQVPPEYQSLNGTCGVILVWTR